MQVKEKSDEPTPEQFTQHNYIVEPTTNIAGGPKRHRRTDVTEINRLLFAGLITPEEHFTLDAFRDSVSQSGLIFSSKSSMEPSSTVGSAQFIADSAFLRAKRISEEMEALNANLGPKNTSIILSMLTSDLRMSPGAMPIVKKAAEVLQSFYS